MPVLSSHRKVASLAIIFFMVLVIVLPLVTFAKEEIPYGPYLDKIVWSEEPDESKAVRLVDKGEFHAYIWSRLPKEDLKFVLTSPNMAPVKGAPGVSDIFINPVATDPVKVGFNPFSIKEVRRALNYLIDREFIVREIYGGYAEPMVTVFRPVSPDYARLYDHILLKEMEYKYNPDLAKSIIMEELSKAGATLKEGKWYFKDKPIKITIVIRVEDERKEIGDYLASKLEELGFEVERDYATAEKAIPKVYAGDPTKGEWHLYTEGWAFTAIEAYMDDLPEFMYTSPWSGKVFEIYKPSPILVDLAKKLSAGEYKTAEERLEWAKKLVDLCLEDSTRVWIAVSYAAFPIHKSLTNVAYDLVGGAYSLFSLRTARFEKIGGEAKVIQKKMFTGAWNPIAGFKWLYDALIAYLLSDTGVYVHPHTGRYIPVRSEFVVKTAGPEGKLPVPEDALKFIPEELKFAPVGPGVNATSAVTFTFTYGKFHHGQEMTKADIMMGIAESFRIANPKDPIYDPGAITPRLRTFIEKFKGIKWLGENKATVYIDYWHIDDSFIASMASVFTGTPWELVAIMNKAQEDRKLAFSDSRAKEWGVEWMSLDRGPSIPILKEILDALKKENYIPPYISEYVTAEEARARYAALADWYEKYGHFLVSNGPFFLSKVDPVAKIAELKAFREYPFKADHWDWLVVPRVPEIEVAPIKDVVPGIEAKIEITSTFEKKPYSEVDIVVMVLDELGRVVLKAPAKLVEPGKFSVSFKPEDTSKLTPGTYRAIIVSTGREAALPKIKEVAFSAIPPIAHFAKKLGEAEASLRAEIGDLSRKLEKSMVEVSTRIGEIETRVGMLMTIVSIAIILAIVGIAVSIYAVRRRS